MFLSLLACADPAEDSIPTELPAPEDTVVDTTPDTFFIDTALQDTGGDLSPEHVLTLTHEGVWSLSPSGGPYTAMTGSLLVTEVLDGDEEAPACAVTYALTGEPAESECDGCGATFVVHHYLAEGSLDTCMDPDLPADAEDRIMGWRTADDMILWNVGATDVWVEWYAGERVLDEVSFAWTADVGVAVEEEE
jgi:hypothetical protein